MAEQIMKVFAEAKGNGFDIKILCKVVPIRKQNRAKRLEDEAILDLYLSAVGAIWSARFQTARWRLSAPL